MDKAELMYECQVCYRLHAESALIQVKEIEYKAMHRVFPWHICYECAEKISEIVRLVEALLSRD